MKEGDDLNAHAWVQLGDWIVNDHSGTLKAFEPLSRWGAERDHSSILIHSEPAVEREISMGTARNTLPERLDASS